MPSSWAIFIDINLLLVKQQACAKVQMKAKGRTSIVFFGILNVLCIILEQSTETCVLMG